MIKPTIPSNELERINALNDYEILDTLPEKEYDELTMIASQICNTPIALISLIDPERQWFKSHHGLDATETPRDVAFCAHAINEPEDLMIVPDASKDERFHDNPLSTGAPDVIFYAGAPLNTPDGHCLGTLCVIDTKPGNITQQQQASLKALASQVMTQLELRKKNQDLQKRIKETARLNRELDAFSYRLSHDLKAPLRGINSILKWHVEDYGEDFNSETVQNFNLISSRISYMDNLIDGMLTYAKATNAKIVYEDFNLQTLITQVRDNVDSSKYCNIQFENTDHVITQCVTGVSQSFQNLVTNSIKFGDKEKCDIKISLIKTDSNYQMTYSDNGPGIPTEYHDKIFRLFETFTDKKSKESTGIGLATVQSVLERLEGSIQIFPNENEGVKFLITLPIQQVK